MSSSEIYKPTMSVKIVKFIIDAVWYLAWFAAAVSALLIIALSFGLKPNALQVSVPVSISYIAENDRSQVPMDERPLIVELTGNAKVLVTAEDKTHRIYIATILPLFVAGLLWGTYQLRCFFMTVKNGEPFHKENPNRLRNLAYLMIASGPAHDISLYIQGWLLYDKFKMLNKNIDLHSDISGELIIAGLVLFVIAQIFDIGVKLQKEQELTV